MCVRAQAVEKRIRGFNGYESINAEDLAEARTKRRDDSLVSPSSSSGFLAADEPRRFISRHSIDVRSSSSSSQASRLDRCRVICIVAPLFHPVPRDYPTVYRALLLLSRGQDPLEVEVARVRKAEERERDRLKLRSHAAHP